MEVYAALGEKIPQRIFWWKMEFDNSKRGTGITGEARASVTII